MVSQKSTSKRYQNNSESFEGDLKLCTVNKQIPVLFIKNLYMDKVRQSQKCHISETKKNSNVSELLGPKSINL